ncbi:hypothetical protein [Streptomyces monomycini]|uniref:hypothetical protein n=1 Tax=Streptomyces monomycini TaxID=371720 RepID=UPI001EEBA79B|nr:hypothetical protein [Streptomyces monomycini]
MRNTPCRGVRSCGILAEMRTGESRIPAGARWKRVLTGAVAVICLLWIARVGFWAVADRQGVQRLGHALNVSSVLTGVVVGIASLAVSWLSYRANHRERATAVSLSETADEFALAVRRQWEAEGRVRRLYAPYALPVSWRPAEAGLVEEWPRPGDRGVSLPDPAELLDTARFPTPTSLRAHRHTGFVPAAYRPRPDRPERRPAARAEATLAFLAHHLEVSSAVDLLLHRHQEHAGGLAGLRAAVRLGTCSEDVVALGGPKGRPGGRPCSHRLRAISLPAPTGSAAAAGQPPHSTPPGSPLPDDRRPLPRLEQWDELLSLRWKESLS